MNQFGYIGLLWHENGKLHFAPTETQEVNAADYLERLVQFANQYNADPETTTGIVLDRARTHDASIYTQQSLVASLDPEAFEYIEKSPYTLTFDEDDTPIGLVFTDNGQVSVREDGEWVEPLPEDPRFYGNEFHFVTENAVELFDRLVQEDSPLTSDAFSEVYV
jgi:hypothetical protein